MTIYSRIAKLSCAFTNVGTNHVMQNVVANGKAQGGSLTRSVVASLLLLYVVDLWYRTWKAFCLLHEAAFAR